MENDSYIRGRLNLTPKQQLNEPLCSLFGIPGLTKTKALIISTTQYDLVIVPIA